MDSHLSLLLSLTAIWFAAGWLADGLPRLDRARALRRHANWVLALTLAGLGLTAAVLVAGLSSAGATGADRATAGLTLAAAPALVVAACTVRRVRRLNAGAAALASAADTPAPHGLRASAAHPLIGLPVQVTGVALLPAVAAASAPAALFGPGVTGLAITAGVLGVVAVGVRHALRHSRLVERATPAHSTSPRAAGALHV